MVVTLRFEVDFDITACRSTHVLPTAAVQGREGHGLPTYCKHGELMQCRVGPGVYENMSVCALWQEVNGKRKQCLSAQEIFRLTVLIC